MQASADPTPSPIGTWLTAGGESQVKVEQCSVALCGRIVWLKNPLGADGKAAIDSENPDPRLRARPLMGLTILNGFAQSAGESNIWNGGTIYDPADGRTYSCKFTVIDADTLSVRGYVGFSLLGRTQTWTRVEGKQ